MLEVGAAGLAAERATGEQLAAMADEITGMFATLDEPQAFLRHDLGFHRAVAAGSGNPIVAAIIGTLTEIIWETGPDQHVRASASASPPRPTAGSTTRSAPAAPERARREMTEHLEHARWEQVKRETGDAGQVQPASDRRRARRRSREPREKGSHERSHGNDRRHPGGPSAHGRREMEMERKRTSASHATCAVALVLTALFLAASLDAQETRGRITGRVSDTTKAPIPGASVTVADVSRGTTASSTTNSEGLFQVNYLLPGTYQVTVEVTGFKKHIQDKVLLQISETRDLPIVLEVGGLEEAVSVTAESRRPQHLGREHGVHRGLEAHRGAPADPRRPVQDHGPRDRPRPLGRPAAGPAVRADAHRRLRLRRHAQQPQRPADRRRAEHLHREPERGHRELRPALRPGPGVQGADRDLRRPVRQHRGRRHQHEHQVRDEPPTTARSTTSPSRRAWPRTTSSGTREARIAPTPPRTGPASASPARSASRASTTGGTRPSSRSATSASRTSARASTPRPTPGSRPRRCATATSPRTRRTSRSTTR